LDKDPIVSFRGEGALMVIGKPAVPALLKLLQDGNPKARLRALLALNCINDLGAIAIPALREATEDVDKEVALDAIGTLARIDPGFRDAAVAAVIKLLKDRDHRFRQEVIGALGNLCFDGLGEQAQDAAVSAIREASWDSDKRVAERARVVLEAIMTPTQR